MITESAAKTLGAAIGKAIVDALEERGHIDRAIVALGNIRADVTQLPDEYESRAENA